MLGPPRANAGLVLVAVHWQSPLSVLDFYVVESSLILTMCLHEIHGLLHFPKKEKFRGNLRGFFQILEGDNFATAWSSTMFLGTRTTYSSRSVDSRGLFCFSMMVGYSPKGSELITKQKKYIFSLERSPNRENTLISLGN